jgi:TRAP transporter TAXI family solute receptor
MKFIVAAVLTLALAAPASAQQFQNTTAPKANENTVGVITGNIGGTYALVGADLTILDDDTLRVLPTLGKGSLQNLSDILYLRGIDIGFVQADALAYAVQHDLFGDMTKKIRYIAKLYDEEVHIIARGDIKQLQDLAGQRVNADVIGSGSAVTAEILFNALGIKPKLEHEKEPTGVQELKRGEIAAVIEVGGAPVRRLADITGEGLHLLPVPLNEALAQTYLPDKFTHDMYPQLVPADTTVPTIAVGDVLAVYAWPVHSDRYNRVSHFIDAFFGKFDQFQQPPRHPKWKEVNLTAEVPGWTRFPAAQEWLVKQTAAGTAGNATQTQFNAFLAQANAGGPPALNDAAKEALFQQFLAWNKQRQAGR